MLIATWEAIHTLYRQTNKSKDPRLGVLDLLVIQMNFQIIYYITVFVVGLSIGSFLNVVIYRIDNIKTILTDRSRCPKCKTVLKFIDLVPFISFLLLQGKCRYCKKAISYQYPVVELATAFVFLLLWHFYGCSWSWLFYATIYSLLIIVFVYDLMYQLIIEGIIWIALTIALLGGWYFGEFSIIDMMLGGVVSAFVPATLVAISNGKWMGAGDIKLALLLGLFLGYPKAIVLLLLSFIIGSIAGLILIALKRKKLKDNLPFAPFLIFSSLITLFWGEYLIRWYLGYVNI